MVPLTEQDQETFTFDNFQGYYILYPFLYKGFKSMVVCGAYLRETRQPLTHKDSVVVYQIQVVVSYLLYDGQTHRTKHAHTCQTHTTREGCGVGSC